MYCIITVSDGSLRFGWNGKRETPGVRVPPHSIFFVNLALFIIIMNYDHQVGLDDEGKISEAFLSTIILILRTFR